MNSDIEKLLQLPNTWQASRGPQTLNAASTGHTELDKALHLGGWPQGATTELLQPAHHRCELQLALPALKQQQQDAAWLVMIDPPFPPFAPALAAHGLELDRLLLLYPRDTKELLWSAVQCLQSGNCSSVLTWSQRSALLDKDLRRLQQAAATGQCWHLLMRAIQTQQQASPSALRLRAERAPKGTLKLNILKQRGGWSGQQLELPCATLAAKNEVTARPVHLAPLPSHPAAKGKSIQRAHAQIHQLYPCVNSSTIGR
ncbi:MAG: translesion DNA synthesis-associated protein ImuA [Cellvibrionaceae bacterium]